jgi:hypothetical protein
MREDFGKGSGIVSVSLSPTAEVYVEFFGQPGEPKLLCQKTNFCPLSFLLYYTFEKISTNFVNLY